MLEAGATGGSLPDTFWMHSNEIYRYGSNEMLLPLDDYLAKSKDAKLENFPDGLNEISISMANNTLYQKILTLLACGTTRRCLMRQVLPTRMILGIGIS